MDILMPLGLFFKKALIKKLDKFSKTKIFFVAVGSPIGVSSNSGPWGSYLEYQAKFEPPGWFF